MTETLTGAQILCRTLLEAGVDVIFGYPGGAIMPFYHALGDHPALRHILVRHEQGAAHMADGYARASGRAGVCVATSGPGATNLVTGIATAMMDSSPIVCITGQVSSAVLGTDAFQETDITGVTLPITKHNYPTLREAFHLARSGRPGPVLVDITKDAQQASMEFEHAVPPRRPRKAPGHPPPEERDLAAAAALIEESERPLVFAGQGVQAGEASGLLREVVEKGQLPVACTLLGLGAFPASHPLCVGMMGMHGEAWVNRAVQEADLLIAVGMRFDDRVTGNLKTYAVNARKIHIEIDPSEINKNVRVDVPLCGEAATILADLLPRIHKRERRAWLDHLQEMSHDTRARDIVAQPHADEALHAAHVMHDLWQETGGK